jgi:hypothetical protein
MAWQRLADMSRQCRESVGSMRLQADQVQRRCADFAVPRGSHANAAEMHLLTPLAVLRPGDVGVCAAWTRWQAKAASSS